MSKTNHFSEQSTNIPDSDTQAALSAEFLALIKKLRSYGPVQFIDRDCAGGCYNYRGLTFDKKGVTINLAMWDDPHRTGTPELDR